MNTQPSERAVSAREALQHYRETGYKEVEGWMGDGLFPLLQICADIQESVGARGGAVEVGIHHGKFFIALNQLCAADEPSMAIDVFEKQDLNVDHSGLGSKERFTDNLKKYCRHAGSNVHILTADSTTVTTGDILEKLRMRPRFFSVDGGHTVRHVLNDMALADKCIGDFGVVLVDDVLNPDWLAVIESICRYLARPRLPFLRSSTIVPFAINSNKLFLCRPAAYSRYFQAFSQFSYPGRPIQFFGRAVIVW